MELENAVCWAQQLQLPWLSLNCLESNKLYAQAQNDLTQQGCKDFARNEACSRSLLTQDRIGTSPTHYHLISADKEEILLKLTEYGNWKD